MNSEYLSNFIGLCLSQNEEERRHGINYLQELKKCGDFGTQLLKLSTDLNINKEVQQIAAIQLKIFVCTYWKKNEEIEINSSDKQFIKENILILLSHCNSKPVFKLFMQITRSIIKFEHIFPNEFFNVVKNYMKSMNQFEIFCGISSFYQYCKLYEFEIDLKRESYNNIFCQVCESLENLMDGLVYRINSDVNFFSADSANYIPMKILYKIVKIFFRTNQMGHLPRILLDQNRFNKWVNYFLFISSIKFNLNHFPETIEQYEFLKSNLLWKIQVYNYETLFKLFEKYDDPSKTNKKDKEMVQFINFVRSTYSKLIFETFISTLVNSKHGYIDEEITSLSYQYFILILNRKHPLLIPLLEENIEMIVNEHLVVGGMLSINDFDLMENNIQEYIYKQYENGHGFKSRRTAISEFSRKLLEYLTNRKKRVYVDYLYNFLLNKITNTSLYDQFDNNNLTKSKELLYKESCLFILECNISNFVQNYSEKQNLNGLSIQSLENIIARFITEHLSSSNNLKSPAWFRDRCFSFIHRAFHTINPKILNESLIKNIIDIIIITLINCNENDLLINIKCALIIPVIIHSDKNLRDFFKNYILNIFSIYLKLIQELELDEIITGLEKLVSVYSSEVIGFSIELTRELIRVFHQYTNDEQISDNINQDINPLDNNDSLDEEDNNYLTTACGIIKTIDRLLQVCSNNKNVELFYKIEEMISPIIIWGFSSNNITSVFVEIINILCTIVCSTVPISNLTWSYYPLILNSLISGQEKGIGFDNIQEIIPIILNFITKDPNFFQNYIGKSLQFIPLIISLSEKDEFNCSCAFKIIITILETYKDVLDPHLNFIVILIIDQMKVAQMGEQKMYKSILLQTIALCYVYNPKLTNSIIENMNITPQLFEMWIAHINNLRFDFEFRRIAMAFSSIFLIHESEINPILKSNLGFLLNKIIELFQKLWIIKENKSKSVEEADVSGDEDNESENENDHNSKNFDFKSKSILIKSQLKDFIEEDLNDSDDYEDSDYNEFDSDNQKNPFKTLLESQDEFLYLRDILFFIEQNNKIYYNYLISQLNDAQRNTLAEIITKAENMKATGYK